MGLKLHLDWFDKKLSYVRAKNIRQIFNLMAQLLNN